MSEEMEFYILLTPTILLFIHDKTASNEENPIKQFESNQFHQVTEEIHDQIMKHIMNNCSQDLILAGFYNNDNFTKD